eukprot:SAG22_NODE_1858_length_3437_cov_1.175554_1_plen_110_part_00
MAAPRSLPLNQLTRKCRPADLSKYTRAIPHPGLWSLPPENHTRNHSLPYETWKELSPRGQHACRYIACDPGEEIPRNDWAPNWHKPDDQNANAKHRGTKVDNPFANAKM